MRLVTGLAAGATLALGTFGAASAGIAQAVEIALRPTEVLLKVEAQGEDRSRPDTMTIEAGIVTTGETAREAMQANNALSGRLIEAVRAGGVAPGDARTSSLSVRPRFSMSDEDRAGETGRRPRILGYVAENSLSLRLRDLSRAADVVSALFTAGANQVTGPTFSHADPAPARGRARKAAIAEAQAEAADYAEALGMRMSRVLRVSERGDFEMEGPSEIIVTGSRLSRTPIEPGEISTRLRVWIDYAMVPK